MKRVGDWSQTYTGRRFWPLDPRPEDVEIEDIAHALSQVCRFGGHCKEFYSVAEHCVRAADFVSDEHKLVALLHDATEAYIGDVIRPLKRQLVDYGEIEQRVAHAIGQAFGLGMQLVEFPPCVEDADEIMLATEARDLMAAPPVPWGLRLPPDSQVIHPWTPREAEIIFLDCFRRWRAQ